VLLPQPPPTLPIWAKALYYLVETAIVTYTAAHYSYASEIPHVGASQTDVTAGSWRMWRVHWSNLQSQDTADDQYTSFEIMNLTDGKLDGTWNSNDNGAVYAYIDAFIASLAPNCANYLQADRVDSYIRGFNPYSESKPFVITGPPEASFDMNHVGGMNAACNPSGCSSCTELTPSRPHWGRFYTPTLGNNSYSSTGRLGTPFVNALANAAHTLYEGLMANQFFPVVATTMSGGSPGVSGKPTRVLQTVTGVRVDDVGDIIRRRRFKNAQVRVSLPVAAVQQPA
jgi:hypothetical protein